VAQLWCACLVACRDVRGWCALHQHMDQGYIYTYECYRSFISPVPLRPNLGIATMLHVTLGVCLMHGTLTPNVVFRGVCEKI
jgi:hypothetical protein